jgi:pimeloyl-ACP methyl ester carboxylesterase
VTPPEIRYARNGDVELAYETFGDVGTGEPLLLIMGLDFQMVWWPDDFCRLLAKNGFAVVRYDNRDTGLSTHFASPGRPDPWKALLGRTTPIYTGRDMLDDALAVMAAAGWTSAHVMGASMGAAQAQALALLHPDRVRSLTSVMGLPAGVGPLKNLTYLRFGVFRQLRKLRPGTTHEERVEFLVGVARAMAGPGYPFPEEWARAAAGISDDRCPRDPRTTQRHLAAGRTLALPPLNTITAPTLVITGADDPIISPRGGRDTARAIPGSTLVMLPGMGHDLPPELWPEIVDHVRTITGNRAAAR